MGRIVSLWEGGGWGLRAELGGLARVPRLECWNSSLHLLLFSFIFAFSSGSSPPAVRPALSALESVSFYPLYPELHPVWSAPPSPAMSRFLLVVPCLSAGHPVALLHPSGMASWSRAWPTSGGSSSSSSDSCILCWHPLQVLPGRIGEPGAERNGFQDLGLVSIWGRRMWKWQEDLSDDSPNMWLWIPAVPPASRVNLAKSFTSLGLRFHICKRRD